MANLCAAWSLLAVWMLLVPAAAPAQPAPADEEREYPFRSVVHRGSAVFASTDIGLYRGDPAARRWVRLTLPDGMPPGGAFANQPEDSDVLLYVASRHDFHRQPEADRERLRPGIYGSRDDGRTWKLLSEGNDYGPVLLLDNGSLFAVTNAWNVNGPPLLRVSADMGATWRDISKGVFGQVIALFPDPDHPGLPCLTVNSIRNYVLQAQDDRFQWQATREWEWHPERFFFARPYSGSPLYKLFASLENYFEFDFGNRTNLPAYDLSPDRPRFTFEPDEPVIVPVTIRFRQNMAVRRYYWRRQGAEREEGGPSPQVGRLIDHPDAVDLWGLQIERDGQRVSKPEPARGVDKEELRGRRRWRTIAVSQAQPYQRTVNLSKLYDFAAPGTYRVQLNYASGFLASPDLGEWISFTSPVFEIVISGDAGAEQENDCYR